MIDTNIFISAVLFPDGSNFLNQNRSSPYNKLCLAFIISGFKLGLRLNAKAMMGEYIIYYRGKIVGGIYDDRFLVKPTKSAKALMPEADLELPAPKKKK